MHGKLPSDFDEKLGTLNSHIAGRKLATSWEKQKVLQWQLKTKQLVEINLRIKFEKCD